MMVIVKNILFLLFFVCVLNIAPSAEAVCKAGHKKCRSQQDNSCYCGQETILRLGTLKTPRSYQWIGVEKCTFKCNFYAYEQPKIDHPNTQISEGGKANPIDPYARLNKSVLKFNLAFMRSMILPVLKGLDNKEGRILVKGFTNFINNLQEPRNILIYSLINDKKGASDAFKRLVCNSTFGILGIKDVYGKAHSCPQRRMSFDCPFKYSSIGAGNYIILPIVNQFYTRTFWTSILDLALNPIMYLNFPISSIIYYSDQFLLLLPDTEFLYKNRFYSNEIYENMKTVYTNKINSKYYCAS